ncbi:hypothetical protein ACOBR2_02715 [Telmatobacter bradus]
MMFVVLFYEVMYVMHIGVLDSRGSMVGMMASGKDRAGAQGQQ